MGVEISKIGLRLRARRGASMQAASGNSSFRISAGQGESRRIVRNARNAEEAMALFWRSEGLSLTETLFGKDLDRRIRRARGKDQAAMQNSQLPLDTATSEVDRHRPRTRKSASRDGAMQADLFEPNAPAAHASEEQVLQPSAEPTGVVRTIEVLDPGDIMLAIVNPASLRPGDRADGYLYHVTTAADAHTALEQGLAVSASDPIILTERHGVAYWLEILAEDYDYIIDGPAEFVVLRMRRHSVEDFIHRDKVASNAAGCSCFLLTGGIGV